MGSPEAIPVITLDNTVSSCMKNVKSRTNKEESFGPSFTIPQLLDLCLEFFITHNHTTQEPSLWKSLNKHGSNVELATILSLYRQPFTHVLVRDWLLAGKQFSRFDAH